MQVEKYNRVTVDGRRVREHILVAEKALGKVLPAGAEVHHVDGNQKNNKPKNLVICPSHPYHMLLPARTKALAACGNPDFRACVYCKEWKSPSDMYHHSCVGRYYCKDCSRKLSSERQRKRKISA